MAKYSKRVHEIVTDLMEDYNEINFKSGRRDKNSKAKSGKHRAPNPLRDLREDDANDPQKRSKRKY